jgi:Ca2+-transporting ATPase
MPPATRSASKKKTNQRSPSPDGDDDNVAATKSSSSKKSTASATAAGFETKRKLQPWTSSAEECLETFKTDLRTGLTAAKVLQLREEYGYNELDKEESRSFWEMVFEQFDDPLVKILLFAAAISTGIALYEAHETGAHYTLDRFVEPIVIILILILNAAIGVYQESSAEASLEALKEMQSSQATVIRDAHAQVIEARDLVPGDVVKIIVGDKIPADCRLVEMKSTTIRLEQSALTGESVAVQKLLDPLSISQVDKDTLDIELQSKTNMLFAGTTVAQGSCFAVVTSIGMKTEIGKIQHQIKEAAEATREEKTPLKKKLDEFSDQLQNLITAVCVLVFVINIRQFVDFKTGSVNIKKALYYFQIAVALAVAAIPEGLPTVITMCLALGTRKMARRNCIVRQLPAVETLGCTTIICSDKTGTLTTNQMSVRRVILLGSNSQSKVIEVTGSSYSPEDGSASLPAKSSKDQALAELIDVCSVCNDSDIVFGEDGKYKHVGAPTEAALKVLVEKLMPRTTDNAELVPLPANTEIAARLKAECTLEFTRDRKSMSVIAEVGKNRKLLVKGAPESIIDRCTHVLCSGETKPKKMTETDRAAILEQIEEMSKKAWRCLAMAIKDDAPEKTNKLLTDPTKFIQIESGMTFVGAVGMQDPPRLEVKKSIQDCNGAGIRVIMITGDNRDTAEAIAREIGMFSANDVDLTGKSFIGSEFSKLPKEQQMEYLFDPSNRSLVFSRAEPKFKQDIVTLLKKGATKGEISAHGGEIVAMTGDGVNDAPALKIADIGIAMGISGTEVAKEASDMVLADDNFSTIVSAIEEGRSIYQNMKAFIRYMISSNIGEVVSIFLTAALGFPEGMISVQLLWVNLVTDGPPATALGFNRAEADVMKRPPRRADDALISGWAMVRFLTIGVYVGIATVGVFATWFTRTEFMGIDLSADGHKPVTLEMLMNWGYCDLATNKFELPSGTISNYTASASWKADGLFSTHHYKGQGCDYFGREGKMKASTLSLSVLVIIEMMNACNALSEDASILSSRLFSNPYLLAAIAFSVSLHLMILYIPFLSIYFDVVPLSLNEWKLVLLFSFPVVVIDEVLKVMARVFNKNDEAKRRLVTKTSKKKKNH